MWTWVAGGGGVCSSAVQAKSRPARNEALILIKEPGFNGHEFEIGEIGSIAADSALAIKSPKGVVGVIGDIGVKKRTAQADNGIFTEIVRDTEFGPILIERVEGGDIALVGNGAAR